MQVLFLNFANSRAAPLPTLQEEDDNIYRLLTPRALRQHYLLHRESYSSLRKIAEYLVLYREHISVFHFSGHAGRDRLLLKEQTAGAEGIAQLLGQCPNLKLVVLNGCSTQGQVQRLLAAGVPAVIATSAPVEDDKATRFGVRFYQGLSEQLSIEEAFNMASGEIKALDANLQIHRNLAFQNINQTPAFWGLFHQEGQSEILKQILPSARLAPMPTDYRPNEKLIDALWDALSDYSEVIEMLQMKAKKADLLAWLASAWPFSTACPPPWPSTYASWSYPSAKKIKGTIKSAWLASNNPFEPIKPPSNYWPLPC